MVDDRIKAACGDKCSTMINDVQSRVGRLMARGVFPQAIVEGAELASRLKHEVPYREDDINELPNHVVLIHPAVGNGKKYIVQHHVEGVRK